MVKMSGNNKYNMGKWAVKEVLKKFTNMGKSVKQYVPSDVEIWGEGDYNGWDYIYIKDKKITCPDIEMYRNQDMNELVMRVEVKSFYDYVKDSGIKTEENVLGIRELLIKDYLKVEKHEEIKCRVVFVLGDRYSGAREFYWETLDNLYYQIPKASVMYQGSGDTHKRKYYFWRVSDLKKF